MSKTRAIGFDMDYTLVGERRAMQLLKMVVSVLGGRV